MFSVSADYYDLFYASKDYREEAATVAGLIWTRKADAVWLLDVACGSGEHGRHLSADHGFRVDGIDIERRDSWSWRRRRTRLVDTIAPTW